MSVVRLLNKNWGKEGSSIRSIDTIRSNNQYSGIAKVGIFEETTFLSFAKMNSLNFRRVSSKEYLIFF